MSTKSHVAGDSARRAVGGARVYWLVALWLVQIGCAGERVVYGSIPPSTFQFTTVIEADGSGPGGWQVAQVVVLLGRLSNVFPRAATCDVEVGVPVVTYLGPVPVERAQVASARSADRAARKLLKERKRPSASICQLFRATMETFLRARRFGNIPGAKVGAFTNKWLVPRETFPPRRGQSGP